MSAIVEQMNATGLTFVQFALPMLIQSSVMILILMLESRKRLNGRRAPMLKNGRGLTSGLKSCGSAESIRNRGVKNGKNRFEPWT